MAGGGHLGVLSVYIRDNIQELSNRAPQWLEVGKMGKNQQGRMRKST